MCNSLHLDFSIIEHYESMQTKQQQAEVQIIATVQLQNAVA